MGSGEETDRNNGQNQDLLQKHAEIWIQTRPGRAGEILGYMDGLCDPEVFSRVEQYVLSAVRPADPSLTKFLAGRRQGERLAVGNQISIPNLNVLWESLENVSRPDEPQRP